MKIAVQIVMSERAYTDFLRVARAQGLQTVEQLAMECVGAETPEFENHVAVLERMAHAPTPGGH